jgi:hypothetical protein
MYSLPLSFLPTLANVSNDLKPRKREKNINWGEVFYCFFDHIPLERRVSNARLITPIVKST